MIFVTVGTHEQQFNRLVKYMDELAGSWELDEEITIQIGYSDYIPKYVKYSKFYSYNEMQKLYHEARIIITHGGPSSFMNALMIGKIPIVVPRKKEFCEHVNNHQVVFCNKMFFKYENIILINDIFELKNSIISYELLISRIFNNVMCNNEKFCEKFNNEIKQLYLNYT